MKTKFHPQAVNRCSKTYSRKVCRERNRAGRDLTRAEKGFQTGPPWPPARLSSPSSRRRSRGSGGGRTGRWDWAASGVGGGLARGRRGAAVLRAGADTNGPGGAGRAERGGARLPAAVRGGESAAASRRREGSPGGGGGVRAAGRGGGGAWRARRARGLFIFSVGCGAGAWVEVRR